MGGVNCFRGFQGSGVGLHMSPSFNTEQARVGMRRAGDWHCGPAQSWSLENSVVLAAWMQAVAADSAEAFTCSLAS